jgi:hypothetical protein
MRAKNRKYSPDFNWPIVPRSPRSRHADQGARRAHIVRRRVEARGRAAAPGWVTSQSALNAMARRFSNAVIGPDFSISMTVSRVVAFSRTMNLLPDCAL